MSLGAPSDLQAQVRSQLFNLVWIRHQFFMSGGHENEAMICNAPLFA